MKVFEVYRKADLSATHPEGTVNEADAPQFQGVQFDDGSVALRWMTEFRSTSVWASFEEMWRVHGHPEYETEILWREVDFAASP